MTFDVVSKKFIGQQAKDGGQKRDADHQLK